ncbi:LytR/AlgR family response regulator transcription factor [Gelidibacter pelagius]|uniref:Response regulator transcription factor n=1 Tax=Gelidibacter pelagius TaxID=2819985 RepID=A0ABS3SUB5_9FLAO|nr:response regulator transcription factor [Gelidibacter pelagius]MBO3099031.1 response regulator transcription factor [Gelidibacter pelagius]
MNCIIIEDQMPAQRILKKYIEDMGTLNLVGTYTDALEAMQVLNSEKIDVMFLDIHLPKLSGIDFLKTLPNPPQVILTTAFSEYALESYELNVVDYLLKPFSFQRFIQAISKLSMQPDIKAANTSGLQHHQAETESKTHSEEIYIKSGYDYIRIRTDDIIFIMVDSDYTEIHLSNKKHLSSESLRYWEDFLPRHKFMRIHKSYIINTTKINKVSGNQIVLENDIKVPVGRAFKSDFMERFM